MKRNISIIKGRFFASLRMTTGFWTGSKTITPVFSSEHGIYCGKRITHEFHA
jgi:hypothetical protein